MNQFSKDTFEIDGWKISNLPVQYTSKDYDEARAEIVKQAENTPELGALFEYGYIPFEGISDMDFWAVFPENAQRMYLAAEPRLSPKTKHVMMHQIALINEQFYKKMLFLDPWTRNIWPDGHRLLYQKKGLNRDFNFENISLTPEEQEVLSVAYIEECMVSVYPTVSLYAKKELEVRFILEDIKNCVYIMREIKKLTGQELNATFTGEFEELRREWFNLKKEEAARRLIKLFEEALLIIFGAAFALGKYLEKHSEGESRQKLGIKKKEVIGSIYFRETKNLCLNTFKGARIYTEAIQTPEEALRLSVASYTQASLKTGWRSKEIESCIVFLPFNFSATLLGSLSSNGLFSRALKKDLSTNVETLPVYKPNIFLEKAKLIDHIAEAYDGKKEPLLNGKGFIYGPNHFGYTFSGEKLRRTFLTWWLQRIYWQTLKKI